ncbi:uncharacterized protein VTP21DRAFT_2432 [Calcarisporiella thermophila]|uniref:uncharacterized protein n=1 Tax=Calcarisporiella thermophila TaxID=911321 RepID=UPI0037443140
MEKRESERKEKKAKELKQKAAQQQDRAKSEVDVKPIAPEKEEVGQEEIENPLEAMTILEGANGQRAQEQDGKQSLEAVKPLDQNEPNAIPQAGSRVGRVISPIRSISTISPPLDRMTASPSSSAISPQARTSTLTLAPVTTAAFEPLRSPVMQIFSTSIEPQSLVSGSGVASTAAYHPTPSPRPQVNSNLGTGPGTPAQLIGGDYPSLKSKVTPLSLHPPSTVAPQSLPNQFFNPVNQGMPLSLGVSPYAPTPTRTDYPSTLAPQPPYDLKPHPHSRSNSFASSTSTAVHLAGSDASAFHSILGNLPNRPAPSMYGTSYASSSPFLNQPLPAAASGPVPIGHERRYSQPPDESGKSPFGTIGNANPKPAPIQRPRSGSSTPLTNPGYPPLNIFGSAFAGVAMQEGNKLPGPSQHQRPSGRDVMPGPSERRSLFSAGLFESTAEGRGKFYSHPTPSMTTGVDLRYSPASASTNRNRPPFPSVNNQSGADVWINGTLA